MPHVNPGDAHTRVRAGPRAKRRVTGEEKVWLRCRTRPIRCCRGRTFPRPNGLNAVHVAVRGPAEMTEPDPQAGDYGRQNFTVSAKYGDISWSER